MMSAVEGFTLFSSSFLSRWLIHFNVLMIANYTTHVVMFVLVQIVTRNDHIGLHGDLWEQDSPAHADKPARLKRMQKLLQFDMFRFISPNSILPNFKLPMHTFTRYV